MQEPQLHRHLEFDAIPIIDSHEMTSRGFSPTVEWSAYFEYFHDKKARRFRHVTRPSADSDEIIGWTAPDPLAEAPVWMAAMVGDLLEDIAWSEHMGGLTAKKPVPFWRCAASERRLRAQLQKQMHALKRQLNADDREQPHPHTMIISLMLVCTRALCLADHLRALHGTARPFTNDKL